MAITMQGNWTVSVKSKAAAYEQRFIIQGSDSADGTYSGETSTPAINVTGAQWTITIEHRPTGKGATWAPSAERLGTPSASGGHITFDIQSNDSGSDEDYNDLVLSCSMPQSPSEFVIYGQARSYAGFCRANPCFPYFFVIDTPWQLLEALKYPTLRVSLEKLYPERVREALKKPPIPDPEPDPFPFRPMMIPLRAGDGQPVASGWQTSEQSIARAVTLGKAAYADIAPYVTDFAKYKDKFKLICTVENQPGLLLRFLEYDRTVDELAGGPYTGTGNRQILGLAVTDEQGNYIFRFTQTYTDIAEEFDDVPDSATSLATELRPDVIVQVVSGTGSGAAVLYETALFPNVPNLRRINLCIPEGNLNPGPTACQGGRAIQAIGNIWTLSGVGNTLDAQGRITATNAIGPQITRGAWRGTLDMFACFIDQPTVAYYTIRFRRPGGSWSFVEQTYKHVKIADIGLPGYDGTLVGPFNAVPLHVDGGPPQTVPYYLNIESNPAWAITHRIRKIQLSSAYYENLLYTPTEDPRTVEFRIDGYNSAGNKVSGADDAIKLYLDSRPVTGDIDSISMGVVAPGECALFELSDPNQTLTIKFRVQQPGGFVSSYNLNVLRGSATPVAVQDVVAPAQPLTLTYNVLTHGNTFFGTANAVAPDLNDFVVAELQAVASTGWLPPDRNFCAFAFEIYGTPRTTNGYGLYGGYRLDVELVGISYETPPSP